MSSLYVLYAGSSLEISARRRNPGFFEELSGMFSSMKVRMERRKAIRELSRLPDRMLQDIGIERDHIEQVVDGKIDARRTAYRSAARLSKPAPRAIDTAVAE